LSDDYAEFPAGKAILLDRLGSARAATKPAGELAIILDIGGRLNKQTEHVEHRFLMRPEQAAELVADLTLTLSHVEGSPAMIDEAIEREKDRRRESG
jgi:hypothetical protein